MCVIVRGQQGALDYQQKYPQAANTALQDFDVDHGLTGAGSVDSAIHLQEQLQCLFALGGFHLRTAEQNIAEHRDQQPSCLIKYSENFTKVLGLEWDTITDTFLSLWFRELVKPEDLQSGS